MPDWYVEPNGTDTTGIFEYFSYINNTATDGFFFPVILLVIWVISFISMLASGSFERPSAAKAWVFSSFFTTIMSIILVVADLVAMKWMYVSIVMLGIGGLWLVLENARE
jgi:hypothetical protein